MTKKKALALNNFKMVSHLILQYFGIQQSSDI